MDYDVDNYTIPELLNMFNINHPTGQNIRGILGGHIQHYRQTGDSKMVNFLQNAQDKLTQYIIDMDNEDSDSSNNAEQTDEWYKNEALPQEDSTQADKITDRRQKIDVYNNQHVPMKREQLGVHNDVEIPYAQDTLNPTLKNTVKRFINIDSQFRQLSGGSEAMSTDFTLNLSDPLVNVLNLKLYSVQIPFNWYVIDYLYGNTCFWITNKRNSFKIDIEPGNYTPTQFTEALQSSFTTHSFATEEHPHWSSFEYSNIPEDAPAPPAIARYNPNNGFITLYLDGWTDPAGHIIQSVQPSSSVDLRNDAYFTFFDPTGHKSCYKKGVTPCGNSVQGQTFSETLGWLMGYRWPLQPIYTSTITYSNSTYSYSGGNKATSIMNLSGPKYIIIIIDDYNQNHMNTGLVTIAEPSNTLTIPSYYNTSQPHECNREIRSPQLTSSQIDAILDVQEITPDIAIVLGINPQNLSASILNEMNHKHTGSVQINPSAPRTLTSAQIYTVNEIIKNRGRVTTYRSKAPTPSDSFAIIPVKGLSNTGDVYVDFSGAMQDNIRYYFGPVNIERMRVKLVDDRGRLIDMHGGDWSFTLISESLYQY